MGPHSTAASCSHLFHELPNLLMELHYPVLPRRPQSSSRPPAPSRRGPGRSPRPHWRSCQRESWALWAKRHYSFSGGGNHDCSYESLRAQIQEMLPLEPVASSQAIQGRASPGSTVHGIARQPYWPAILGCSIGVSCDNIVVPCGTIMSRHRASAARTGYCAAVLSCWQLALSLPRWHQWPGQPIVG